MSPSGGRGVCTQEGRSQDTCCFVWPLDVPVGGREGVCVFLAGCGFVDVCVVVTCILENVGLGLFCGKRRSIRGEKETAYQQRGERRERDDHIISTLVFSASNLFLTLKPMNHFLFRLI